MYVNAETIGVFGDAHLDIDYQPDIPIIDMDNNCHDLIQAGVRTKDIANFGRRGCDSPLTLVKTTLLQMSNASKNFDVLLYVGDMASHHLPVYPRDPN